MQHGCQNRRIATVMAQYLRRMDLSQSVTVTLKEGGMSRVPAASSRNWWPASAQKSISSGTWMALTWGAWTMDASSRVAYLPCTSWRQEQPYNVNHCGSQGDEQHLCSHQVSAAFKCRAEIGDVAKRFTPQQHVADKPS